MMRGWPTLLGGLVVWAAHFFLLYGLGEFAADTRATRFAIGALTIACIAIDLVLLRLICRHADEPFERWQRQVGIFGLALSTIAILWQGLVALF